MSQSLRKPVPFWMIWANPIVRRYARSRLRPVGLGVWLLLAVLIAGFIFFVSREGAMHRGNMSIEDAARIPLIPLLVLQGIILFVLATGQVAGAMTAEADEGVLDYQRLAPMTPLAKVTGYLFGLPIREWVMFVATLPFSIFSMWQGEVPLSICLQLYAVFVVAGTLYHLTGLLAGTVMKNRRWAFLSSMGLVFVLYTLVPQAAKFGLVYFKYVTIMPVVEECFPYLINRRAGALVETYQSLVPTARFFGLNLPQTIFTLLSQGILILAMVTMLWRRWRRSESHLLGKIGAVGLFAWIQLVLLGNSLPLIDTGELFPSRELGRRFGRIAQINPANWTPDPAEGLVMVGLFGLVSLLMMWWMTLIITPNHECQMRGWRRARKVDRKHLPLTSDAATGVPWVMLMIGMAAFAWWTFARILLESRWFVGYEPTSVAPVAMVVVFITAGLGFSALLEGKGKRAVGMTTIFAGVVPIFVGTVLAVSSDQLATASIWLMGICPLSWPVYGAVVSIPNDDIPREIVKAIPNSFWFWQLVGLLVVGWLLVGLWKARRAVARFTIRQVETKEST
ncbi:hypothetical protein [Haloferula sp.]|uniref:hypothetical protein n=1 Tax=Haloferula sp. TaxID=2497595 RepID=UPI003C76A34B